MQRPITRRLALGSAILVGLSLALGAQAGGSFHAGLGSAHQAGSFAARDRVMQVRIENGLRTGQLNAHEAGRLEQGMSRIGREESADLKNGPLTLREQRQLNRRLDKEASRIDNLKNNDRLGNPDSRNSTFMEADIQRSVNQEARIHAGVDSGMLTQKEAARLQGHEAFNDRIEARAASDGTISADEQARINADDNQTIRAMKHDETDPEANKAREGQH